MFTLASLTNISVVLTYMYPQAQRAMASSVMVPPRASPNPNVAQIGVDLNGLNLVVPPPMPPVPGTLTPGSAQGPGRDREGQFVRRVRELEEEVRVLKVDNEKQVRPPIISQNVAHL